MIYQASNIKLEVGFLEKLVDLSGARESHPRATQLFHVDYFIDIQECSPYNYTSQKQCLIKRINLL